MKQLFEITNNIKVKQLGSDRVKMDFTEDELEELIFNNPAIISDNIFFIGRQVITSTGKRLDLIAIDNNSNIIVIELKRGIAPREIIAQVLDYTSWLYNLSEREIENIIKSHFDKYKLPYKTIVDAFEKIFNRPIENRIGNEIIPVLFADEYPEEIINAINYLTNYGVPIKCIEFDVFKGNNDSSFLYTFDIVDQLSDEESSSSDNVIVHEDKYSMRQIIRNLSSDLNSKYTSWFTNLKYQNTHKFQVYQNRQGTWTSSYIDWKIGNNLLCLEIPIWPKTEDDEKGFCVKLWFRKILSVDSFEKLNNLKHDLKSSYNFEDESQNNRFIIVKSYYGNIEYEYIKKSSFEAIDILKNYIEKIMELF